jgi:transcriptional regulator with XRE-family HTH domain
VLLAARRSRGPSQRALAARAGEHQPTISALENGDHDPGLAHLGRLLAATGHRLVALPTTARPVYEAGADIAAALRRGDDAAAYREFIQLSDELARESGPLRAACGGGGRTRSARSGERVAGRNDLTVGGPE